MTPMSINERSNLRVEFCLPVRNEEKILEANARRLFDFLQAQELVNNWQIVVIINGSQDQSAAIAQNLVNQDRARFRLHEIERSGKGLALKQYFSTSCADVLVFMDIDLAVSLDNLPSLLLPILEKKADLVIGSRLLPNSQTSRSFWRSLVSNVYNLFSRIILGHDLSDLQCGFKALTRDLFNRVQPLLRDDNWFFDTELVIFSFYFGYRIKEVPVNWREDRYDERKSKIRVVIDVWAFLKNLFFLRRRLYFVKKYHDSV